MSAELNEVVIHQRKIPFSLFSPGNQEAIANVSEKVLHQVQSWKLREDLREKEISELEGLLGKNIIKGRGRINVVWTIKDGFNPQGLDEGLLLSAGYRMAVKRLNSSPIAQTLTVVNPNNGTETRYFYVKHEHCACIRPEKRETGQPWPSEVNPQQSECRSKI